jgi:hypothetical protein
MISESQFQHLPAAQILAMTGPTELFSSDLVQTIERWRQLRKIWHPDRAKDPALATQVFTQIKHLYELAQEHIHAGVWGLTKIVSFEGKTSKFSMGYFKSNEVEGFGTQYVGRHSILYYIPDSNEDLIKVWVENCKKLTSSSPDIVKEFSHQFNAKPRIEQVSDGFIAHVQKDPGYLNLQHILEKGPLDPKHVAWIMSRLINLSCMMQHKDVPNLGITPRSIFINPALHSLILADGWQYAEKFFKKALAAPGKVGRLCPDLMTSHEPKPSHIVVQIKAVGRDCLGDSVGINLSKNKALPKPFAAWLNMKPTSADCIKEFSVWESVKKASFGPPKFIHWELTEKDVYQ